MSGYLARLAALREAVVDRAAFAPAGGVVGLPEPYRPADDALLRRVAERLSDELVDDVVALIMLARGNR